MPSAFRGLAIAMHITLGEAVALGMLPFLVGDALKALLAAAMLPLAWRLLRSFE
jgi:biotin transport system substrate-specific component